jgi:hypothetical protein
MNSVGRARCRSGHEGVQRLAEEQVLSPSTSGGALDPGALEAVRQRQVGQHARFSPPPLATRLLRPRMPLAAAVMLPKVCITPLGWPVEPEV